MAQWYGYDDLGGVSITSVTTLDLSNSYLKLGGQAYQTGLLTLDTSLSGAGGLDTGAMQSNTNYTIYVVLDAGIPAILASLSSSSPTGFSIYNDVGVFKTDGSADILTTKNSDELEKSVVTLYNGSAGLIVDTSGSGDYTSIQDALDASSDGTKIVVLPGTYTESITVSKEINLEGQGNNTIINGTVAFNTGANNCAWYQVKFNDDVTVANGVEGVTLASDYINPLASLTDNNPSDVNSLYLIVEEI